MTPDGDGENGRTEQGTENIGRRFDRLPETDAERTVRGRATRAEVLAWFEDRFAIPPQTFDPYTFWEKGNGKIWICRGAPRSPIEVQGLGMTILRTRQEHWKPTTDGVQRFGRHATKNVIELDENAARRFVLGKDQEIEWDGDWGYLICAHDLVGTVEPLGVGLYVYGELRSMVPKGRRRKIQ